MDSTGIGTQHWFYSVPNKLRTRLCSSNAHVTSRLANPNLEDFGYRMHGVVLSSSTRKKKEQKISIVKLAIQNCKKQKKTGQFISMFGGGCMVKSVYIKSRLNRFSK